MKKTGFLIVILTITFFVYGQTVKIQGGTSVSRFDWKLLESYLFRQSLVGYSIFAGVDYLDKRFFNLSSNVGMIRKGGRLEYLRYVELGSPSSIYKAKATLDYLSVNTTIDFKYRTGNPITPFISLGPRFDYLLNSDLHFKSLKDIIALKSASIGLILGGGLIYEICDFQFGLRADYYLDLTKVADWTIEYDGKEISVKTYTLNMSIGYRLK